MAGFRVRVTPRAGKDAIAVAEDGSLHVHLTAPPVDGRANDALERLLARVLDVPPRDVRVVRGQSARIKFVEVTGLDEPALRRKLANLLAG